MFSLGALCIACTVGRTTFIRVSFSFAAVSIWETAEMGTAIIVASCPSLKWLYYSLKYYPHGGNLEQEEGSGSSRSQPGNRFVNLEQSSNTREEWGVLNFQIPIMAPVASISSKSDGGRERIL